MEVVGSTNSVNSDIDMFGESDDDDIDIPVQKELQMEVESLPIPSRRGRKSKTKKGGSRPGSGRRGGSSSRSSSTSSREKAVSPEPSVKRKIRRPNHLELTPIHQLKLGRRSEEEVTFRFKSPSPEVQFLLSLMEPVVRYCIGVELGFFTNVGPVLFNNRQLEAVKKVGFHSNKDNCGVVHLSKLLADGELLGIKELKIPKKAVVDIDGKTIFYLSCLLN